MTEAIGHPYPSEQQELLLQAALLSDQVAVGAWEKWSKKWKVEEYLDNGSLRLLPLVYRNLANLKIEDAKLPFLKDIYKQSYNKNHKLFKDSKPFLMLFAGSKIPALMLKGAVLAIAYYNDIGARPMSDIDVLIPVNMAEKAIEILNKEGWKPEFEEYIEYNLKYGRSMMFYNDDGFEFDLHWFPFFESLSANNIDDFWNHALKFDFYGFQTLALSPEDNLLHTIIHGIKWNPEPPIRWIPDAMSVINSADPAVDWHRFTDQVTKYKVALKVKEAFEYLHKNFDAEVPVEVMEKLQNSRHSFAEKLLYNYDKKTPDRQSGSFSGKLKMLVIVYLRQAGERNLLMHLIGFVRYLSFRTKGKPHFKLLWQHLTKRRTNKNQDMSL